MADFRTIADSDIRNVWQDVETQELVYITPDWYEQNGTPQNEDGQDFTYLYTEIKES